MPRRRRCVYSHKIATCAAYSRWAGFDSAHQCQDALSLPSSWRHPSSWRSRNRRSEEHTSELQSLAYLVCRLLLEKKKKTTRLPPLVPLIYCEGAPSKILSSSKYFRLALRLRTQLRLQCVVPTGCAEPASYVQRDL